MVPTWLSRTLEVLPGRPRAHIFLLIGIVMVLDALDHIFKQPYLLMPISMGLFILVMKLDFGMMNKELVDLRDWVVVRTITCTFWLSCALWVTARVIHGITSWIDYLLMAAALYIFLQTWPDIPERAGARERTPQLERPRLGQTP